MKKFVHPVTFVIVLLSLTAAVAQWSSTSSFVPIAENISFGVDSTLGSNFSSEPAVSTSISNLDSFHFLPPLAPKAGDPSKFDASLLNYLTVEVCQVDGANCPVVKTFTAQSASSERLRIVTSGKEIYYTVNWDTQKFNLNGKTYRVSVFAADLPLGTIDLAPDVYKTFARTWPIKFLIESDPVIRVRVTRFLGKSCSQSASVVRNEFGLGAQEVAALLANDLEPCSQDEINVALNGVYQNTVILTTTKVSDALTRAALTSFNPDTGVMNFSSETALLRNLTIGDVMVDEPGPAAPFGYLRKVTGIQRSKGKYTINTVQARLDEAIQVGTLDAAAQLKPSDLVRSEALVPGVTFDPPEQARSKLGPAVNFIDPIDIGEGLNFNTGFDFEVKGGVGEGGVEGTGSLHIYGSVRFNAGYNVGIGIEDCFDEFPPVCVDRFEAWAGVEQYANIRIEGNFTGTLKKEIRVARHHFGAIVFFIGPIPVVIVPVIDVVIGVDGKAQLQFKLGAELRTSLKAGAKWTDPDQGGNGWEDISDFVFPPSYNSVEEGFDANMSLLVYGKGEAKLLFYGIAGPGFSTSVGLGGDVEFGRKPLWRIFGNFAGSVNFHVDIGGVVDIGEHSEPLFNEEFTILEAPNLEPQCSFNDGVIPANVNVPITLGPSGGGFFGYFDCTDPEGDILNYSAALDPGGAIPLRVTFNSPGERKINITATDTDGKSKSFTLTINVVNTPPIVTLATASTTVQATVQYFVTASAYDVETSSYLPCNSINWSVNAPDVLTVRGFTASCTAVVVFPQEGSRQISVTATDQHGGSTTRTISVNVTGPPPNPAPVIDLNSLSIRAARGPAGRFQCPTGIDCEAHYGSFLYFNLQGDYDPPLTLRLNASDPGGAQPTVQWFCEAGPNQAPVTANGDGSFNCSPPVGSIFPIVVRAVVSDGVTSVNSEVRHFFTLSNPN